MSEYHSKYWAYALTLKSASNSIRNLSRSIANASVDLNPHQVRAALFALQSPLSKGVILADEVGLGKTIEAGLVIAQKWAEKKRNILLIVPAFLRKQWESELQEKFYLPTKILDSKVDASPFESSGEILICSYQFAAQRSHLLQKNWDLVVIDEAHRMRNVYKSSNKQARSIAGALERSPKILLTATPLQNNLLELYGLISVIDPYIFGDEISFKDQFILSRNEESRNQILKKRIEPLIIRTLRKQVKEYIPLTKRIALTHEFVPDDDEQRLYEAVSAYLQREDLAALPNSQRQLITLVLRKLLASSSFAITHTLRGMVERLEKEAGPRHLLEELDPDQLDAIDEELKERLQSTLPDQETRQQKEKIREEAQELRTYLELAEKIRKNNKGETLLIALEEALKKADELGSSHKAVIFTESTRTQAYLYEHLSANGYKGQIVRINGSNNNPDSKAIYQSWVESKECKSKTGSKAVEMKGALVDYFRKSATILLATEAAAEGINLQFCSLVINYDLPWNPQRVEQRIGRCHRYGQKHDVVVVNFVNTRNEADKRVFELLREKFKLFDGVFGASDEILGAIESGIDIEMRIHEIYQTARTTEQIKSAFDLIQMELDEQIQMNLQQTRRHLLDHFDEDVTSLLRFQQNETTATLSQREKWLQSLIKAELGLEKITSIFNIPGYSSPCTFNWQESQETGAHFLREDDPPVFSIIEQAMALNTPTAELHFNYSEYNHKISLVEPLIGASGWLSLSLLEIKAFEKEQHLIFAGITDDGIPLDPETCEKLFQLQASSASISLIPPSFEANIESQCASIISEVENRAGSLYESEVEKLDAWSDDLKLRLEKELKILDKEIRDHRKRAAAAPVLAEKLQIQQAIRTLEKQRSQKRSALFEEEDRIDSERDSMIEKCSNSVHPQSSLTPLFQIRFKVI
ncbi:MAG TPA: SNF2-related protein [Rhabdochlamydiaceae bacterium]|nr:SNF2-related protein [Rhabdochlamydiaceae bacterium]HSX38210.1 SNF2-related protein [Chlamydiales bacterium]